MCGGLGREIDWRFGQLGLQMVSSSKVALCQANVFMETGLIVYPLALRGALVLIVVTRLVALLTRVTKPSRPRTARTQVGLRPGAWERHGLNSRDGIDVKASVMFTRTVTG